MKNLQQKLKQLFEEKGEIVVLIGAAALGSLMLLTSLFWPGSGFFSSSSSGNAAVLTEQVTKVQARMTSPSNMPSGADAPVPEKLKNLPNLLMFFVPDANKYQVAGLFDVPLQSDGQRRQPRILKPIEGLAASFLARTKVYMIKSDESGVAEIFVLKDAPTKPGNNAANNLRQQMGGAGKGGRSGGAGGMNLPQMGGSRGFSPMGAAGDTTPKDHKGVYIPLTNLTDKDKLASQALPLKLAIITFAYPYRAQLDEFRAKLHLPSYDAVEKELSKATTADNKPLPSLRFLGVKVERREVDLLGNPLNNSPEGGWVALDFEKEYKPYILHSGRETQPDDAAIQNLKLEGAVMPRLLLLDKEDHYPDIETKLVSIKKEIDSVKTNIDNQPRPLPSQFSDAADGSSILFSSAGSATNNPATDPRNTMGLPNAPGRPGGGRKAGPSAPTAGVSGRTPAGQVAEPTEPLPSEYLLGRIIDVTVEAGKIYQYRLRVLMANPNFGRDDVANPSFAEKTELDPADTTDPWFVVPQIVKVPADWKYYLADFTTTRDPLHPTIKYNPSTQAPFQIHRWVEWQGDKPGSGNRPIGDWAIAEKVIVTVGQYIGRQLHVELPVWIETRDAFIIPTDKNERGQLQTGLNVNFAHPGNESVLVDIEGPDLTTYTRGTVRTKDEVDTEAIVLSHEGKLVVYNNERDKNDKERIQRVEHWKNRVKATKDHASGASAPSNPFGGGGPK